MSKQTGVIETEVQARERLAMVLQDLPDRFVMCRDMRHAWVVEKDFHVSLGHARAIQEITRVLVCMRCTTQRVEAYVPSLNWGLEKVYMHYVYPIGYMIHGVPWGSRPSYLVQAEQYRRTMMKVTAYQSQK